MTEEQKSGILKAVNELAKHCDTNLISDGYHTFGELYEHRIALYIALCKSLKKEPHVIWRSKKHADGTSYDGWFILGIDMQKGGQISYHLPESKWGETEFANMYKNAPDFDGHTGADVLQRLKDL